MNIKTKDENKGIYLYRHAIITNCVETAGKKQVGHNDENLSTLETCLFVKTEYKGNIIVYFVTRITTWI